METIEIILLFTTFLCTMVAGLVYTFAVVVMPGIRQLNDHDFLNAFKVMDGIIQNNHPLFMIVWVGSVLSLLSLFTVSFWTLNGIELLTVSVATFLYLFGVQLPTLSVNVPLNNKLQSLNLKELSQSDLNAARNEFETTWVIWNIRRTWVSVAVTLMLIALCIQI